jgi:predicted PurR-regulated permease PerM
METIKMFFQKPFIRRLLILAVVGLFIYITRSMITLYLLTFIFIYLINAAQKFIYKHIRRFIHVKRSLIVILIYLVVIALLVLVICAYMPKVVRESIAVIATITNSVKSFLATANTNSPFLNYILNQVKNVDLEKYLENGGKYLVSILGNIGVLSFNIFLALILSMFFMFQKTNIYAFMAKFSTSKISFFYSEVKYFGIKFMNTFGKVLQTQILLSFINCILSMIVLWIMQIPNVLGLGVMMFLLGIIPVAGVFISLAPLSIIAFLKGGWNYVLAVLIMTIVLHFLGSYVLYPKLMSDKLKLPVFFTFLILIISAHYFGVWGMLVGTPVFVFLLDILDVKINDTNPKLPDPSLIKSKSIGGNAKSEIAAADKSGKIK